MSKIIKILFAITSLTAVIACSLMPQEESKTVRARGAQDRINASKNAADVITKDLDD